MKSFTRIFIFLPFVLFLLVSIFAGEQNQNLRQSYSNTVNSLAIFLINDLSIEKINKHNNAAYASVSNKSYESEDLLSANTVLIWRLIQIMVFGIVIVSIFNILKGLKEIFAR